MDYREKKVLVVGMGKSGVSAAQLLQREGARVTVTDIRSRKALGRKVYDLERSGIIVETGKHRPEFFHRAELIVLSPGVPMTMTPLDGAIRMGIPVIGEMELGFSFLKAPVVAVTGSNGKSTTTTLLGDILEAAGKKVFVGGNLGTPLCQFVLSGDRADWVVVEVSSFQLETIRTFRPGVAVFLNVTPDHLDRYRDVQEYAEAKFRIFENQTPEDFAVLNGDDPRVDQVLSKIRSVPVLFSRNRRIEGGVFTDGESIITSIGGVDREVCGISRMGIQGVHNLENTMAAAAAAQLVGCPVSGIGESLQKFGGLEHRMEFVRELQGVRYVNDSKGTNVGAVIRSLESFEGPVIWIAGGRDKAGDFAPLRDLIPGRVKRLILIGEAREKIKAALGDLVETREAGDLREAVAFAYHHSRTGDVVLLSPACASFDMFKNFEERGETFKKLVWGLPGIAFEKSDGNVSAG